MINSTEQNTVLYCRTLVCFFVLIFTNIGFTLSDSQLQSWADAAHAFTRTFNCSEIAFIASKIECRQIRSAHKSSMAVHIAPPDPRGKFQVVLPERTWTFEDDHDAVIALDPYPSHMFGHLIVLFYVDRGMTNIQCRLKDGMQLANNYCLYLAVKRRCRYAFHEGVHVSNRDRFCEVHFLPVVNFRQRDRGKAAQYLACQEDLDGFASCRMSRNTTATVFPPLCDPVRTNNPSCPPPANILPSPCRQVFMRCDQAVLLAGGWRPESDAARAETNVRILYHRLRQIGFQISNIHSFVTDGQIWLRESLPSNFHPVAGMKVAFRNHLQSICSTDYCTNSLVLYLNNPTRLDGSMLLWDMNHDGKASADERYSVDELVHDLQWCRAKRVVLLVEQNYVGDIKAALDSRADQFHNTVMISSTSMYELSLSGGFTNFIVDSNLKSICLETLTKNLSESNRNLSIGSFVGSSITSQTIFGAPCDHLAEEDNMAGCLALPSSIRLRRFLRTGSRASTF